MRGQLRLFLEFWEWHHRIRIQILRPKFKFSFLGSKNDCRQIKCRGGGGSGLRVGGRILHFMWSKGWQNLMQYGIRFDEKPIEDGVKLQKFS